MKRVSTLAAVLALTGCGNILGIEVLSYDGGADGSTDGGPTTDGNREDSTSATDGPRADGSDAAEGGSTDGTSPEDVAVEGDATQPGDAPGSETGIDAESGAPEAGLPEGGCSTGDVGCDGNTPWSCVGGQPTDGTACSNQTCVAGSCMGVCSPGQTQCTAGDTSFQSCQANGTWGTTATCTGPTGGSPTCDPSTGCGAGTCSSAGAPDLCGTACTDLQTDSFNCGVCGQTCTSSTCSGGHCTPTAMCDGTGDGSVTNPGNVARLGFQMGVTGGLQKVLYGYFVADNTVYDCTLPATAPSPVPTPVLDLGTGTICATFWNDAVSDKTTAYAFETSGGDCHGSSLYLLQSDTNIGGAVAGTLLADLTTTGVLYTLSGSTLDVIAFDTDDAGTETTSSTTCLTVSNALGDGAAGGGFVVGVDTTAGVIRGAKNTAGTCGTPANLATGVTTENAIAVAPTGATFAFENGANLYVCPTTGCTAGELATPYAAGVGAIARNGLAFDGANLYWIGSAGLQRCSGVTAGGSCTPTTLEPGLKATSGIGFDSTFVYYLQGMVLSRAPK